MQASVIWEDKLRFRADTESGYSFLIDGDSESGPSPMEYIIHALGGCSSIDVVMILKKGRQAITGCRCELKGERAETSPRVFKKIHAHFVVEGSDLTEKPVRRAVDLAFEKYCSVSLMLDPAVEITHSFEILEA